MVPNESTIDSFFVNRKPRIGMEEIMDTVFRYGVFGLVEC